MLRQTAKKVSDERLEKTKPSCLSSRTRAAREGSAFASAHHLPSGDNRSDNFTSLLGIKKGAACAAPHTPIALRSTGALPCLSARYPPTRVLPARRSHPHPLSTVCPSRPNTERPVDSAPTSRVSSRPASDQLC